MLQQQQSFVPQSTYGLQLNQMPGMYPPHPMYNPYMNQGAYGSPFPNYGNVTGYGNPYNPWMQPYPYGMNQFGQNFPQNLTTQNFPQNYPQNLPKRY